MTDPIVAKESTIARLSEQPVERDLRIEINLFNLKEASLLSAVSVGSSSHRSLSSLSNVTGIIYIIGSIAANSFALFTWRHTFCFQLELSGQP